MKPIVIFGCGQIAELAYYYFTHDSLRTVSAFCVDKTHREQDYFCELPLLDFENIENHYPPETHDFFVATGYRDVNKFRTRKVEEARNKGYTLASYISSHATTFSNLSHGDNCFILENTVIQPFATIGNNVTLWSTSHIGHHSVIEDNVFMASSVVAGACRIQKNTFLGAKAIIFDHITIAANNIVIGGSSVNKSTDENSVYRGNPARKLRIPSNRLKGF